ncbi:MAG: hypothetical protein ACRENE_25685 [Polyangiaceae bacterium]
MTTGLPEPPIAEQDVGLGTAYERVAIYDLFDRWAAGRSIATAAEGPLDGMAGIAGLHLMGLARRGVRVTVHLPDDGGLARVRAMYSNQGISDRLTTQKAATDAVPAGPCDVVVSYNALPCVPDWRSYLARLLAVDARWFFVVVSNPVSYGTYLRRAQRAMRGERARELFDQEVTRRAVIEPEIERVARIAAHDYLDCPWWPDFVLPARKNLAGDALALAKRVGSVAGFGGRDPRSTGASKAAGSNGAARRYVFGADRYPFFEGAEGYAELRSSMRLHPVFDRAPEPLARFFGHLHGYLVERR